MSWRTTEQRLRMQRNGAVGAVGARRSQAGLSEPHPFRLPRRSVRPRPAGIHLVILR
jgi:hypothetical protein